jgi:hypothetical protein
MSAPAPTLEAFFAFLDARPDTERWELIDGRPMLMVGVTRADSAITLNMASALHPVARRRGCEVHSADLGLAPASPSVRRDAPATSPFGG